MSGNFCCEECRGCKNCSNCWNCDNCENCTGCEATISCSWCKGCFYITESTFYRDDLWGRLGQASQYPEDVVNVFDVADYILSKTGVIWQTTLMKLVYYCQAWYLTQKEQPLFNEKFKAEDFGPNCPALYAIYNRKIEAKNCIPGVIDKLNSHQKRLIDRVVEIYSVYKPHELADTIRCEEPYLRARRNSEGTEITIKSMWAWHLFSRPIIPEVKPMMPEE